MNAAIFGGALSAFAAALGRKPKRDVGLEWLRAQQASQLVASRATDQYAALLAAKFDRYVGAPSVTREPCHAFQCSYCGRKAFTVPINCLGCGGPA